MDVMCVQQVCPFNQRAKVSRHACFEPKVQDVYVSCDEIVKNWGGGI